MRLLAWLLTPVARIGYAIDERHRRTEAARLALAASVAECRHRDHG